HASATRFMAQVRAIPGIESLYIVTHDVDLALTHADRILLFREGRVVADGPPGHIVEDEERWVSCNLRPTSLMRANTRWRSRDDRFLGAEDLARWLIGRGVDTREGKGGAAVEAG